MKNFIGEITDTLPINNPAGSWHHSRNIVMTKGYKSIANEDGNKFSYLVPGTSIGFIVTNFEVVYLIININGECEIGRVDKRVENPIYKTVVITNLFNFKLNCPIEGIFIYNFKNELIIKFSDGIKEESNTPKLLNLDKLGVVLNNSFHLVNNQEFNKFELFPNVKEGDITITYLEAGTIDGYAAYITYAYVFEDNSTTTYFPTNVLTYLGVGNENIDQKGLRINFTNLDTNFKRIRLGIVLNKEGNLFGYESYFISYANNTASVDLTTLLNFTITSVANIVLERATFDKIQTITKYDNQSIVANITTKNPIEFQKYANLLRLKPYLDTDFNNTPHLMPDEVYAIYIQLQNLDGTYGEGFHIPGDEATGTDRNNLTPAQTAEYNLNFASGYKQFHLINKGIATINNNSANKFGYWENEETYPNNDNFNSTSVGGQDLRNTNIRYHRMPGIDSIININGSSFVANRDPEGQRAYYRLYVTMENFNTVVPQHIKNQIQGYRLCIIKRNTGTSYVVGNWVLTRRNLIEWEQAGVDTNFESYDFNISALSDESVFGSLDINFSKARVISNELFKFRPKLDLTYLKTNYLFRVRPSTLGERLVEQISNANKFSKIEDNITYKAPNNLADNTLYQDEGININLRANYLRRQTGTVFNRYNVANVTVFSHKVNLYSGFKSNNFIVLGRTSKINDSKVLFEGGDVFNNNETDLYVHTAKMHDFSTRSGLNNAVFQYVTPILINGLYSPLNNSKLENTLLSNDGIETIGDNEEPQRIDVEKYNKRDYIFEVLNEPSLSTINDINTILSFDVNSNFVNRFPFRIYRGLAIPNENLTTNALRTYLTNDYYEMPNDKGEIIALRAKERTLYIQHELSLFVASVKDKLKTERTETYLGDSELFGRIPAEVMSDDKGFVGSTSRASCVVIKGAYITINSITGKIFYLKDSLKELNKEGKNNYFLEHLKISSKFKYTDINNQIKSIDNPFISVGHLISYDEDNNRLFIVKKDYQFKQPNLITTGFITFDGEFYRNTNGEVLDFNDDTHFENIGFTYSYDLNADKWVCQHDYNPNLFYYLNIGLYMGLNSIGKSNKIYKHNIKGVKGTYFDKTYLSYVDLIFNAESKVSKLLQTIELITEVLNIDYTVETQKTITHLMIYNNTQCSGIINIKDNMFEITKNANDSFNINDFRDIVKNEFSPVILKNGELIQENLDYNKNWFEKSNFSGKFIVVRLIIDNQNNTTTYIHEVIVNSIKKII